MMDGGHDRRDPVRDRTGRQPVAAPELPNPHLWFSTSPRSREARAYRHARRDSRCRRPLSSAAMSGDSAGLRRIDCAVRSAKRRAEFSVPLSSIGLRERQFGFGCSIRLLRDPAERALDLVEGCRTEGLNPANVELTEVPRPEPCVCRESTLRRRHTKPHTTGGVAKERRFTRYAATLGLWRLPMWPQRRNRAVSAAILLLFHAFAGGHAKRGHDGLEPW